jgi:hypothetical protein
MTNQDFNDDIGFGDELEQVLNAPARVAPQAPAQAPALHFERCWKCAGRGVYGNFGTCFACNGKGGKAFKQPAAVRAKAREQVAARKTRTETENVEAFQAANPAEWLWLCDRVKWEMLKAKDGQDFGQSLLRAITKYGDLTEKQMAAVRSNMAKRAAAIEARATAAPAPVIDVARIEVAFATALASGFKKKLTLRLATTKPGPVVDGVETVVLKHAFVFNPAPATGKNPGAVYVKEGQEYLGKIVAGRFQCVATCGDERRDDVVAAAGDPAQAAVAYGKTVGECAICGAELTAGESINRGIGPVCAERYGF